MNKAGAGRRGMEVSDWLDLAAGVLNVLVDVIDTLLLLRQR